MENKNALDNLVQSISAQDFKNIWYRLTNKTKDKKELLIKDRDEYGWSLFNSYDSFFEECIGILTDKDTGRKIREIYGLIAEIDENNGEIAELREKHFTAPEKSWNPLVDTQSEIMEDIADLEKKNKALEAKINDLKFEVLECFNQHGIELERTQLDFIISSVVKENLANLLLVTDSLKQILCSIEKQMTDAGDHAVVKNYTSVYLVTLLTLRQAQDVAIRDLETNATRVDTLIQVAKDNINEACTIAGYEHDKTLQSNIKLNERSIQISKTYKDILLNFSKQLADERPGLERSIKVARNLYNTVETASNLITVIKQSSYDYKALFRFSMPKINQIYASNMAREFDNISAKLRELQSQE